MGDLRKIITSVTWDNYIRAIIIIIYAFVFLLKFGLVTFMRVLTGAFNYTHIISTVTIKTPKFNG